MKVLIAIVSCHLKAKEAFRQAQRDTWLKGIDIDYKFFFGQGNNTNPDEIILNCGDSYIDLPHKVKGIYKYALDNGYSHCFKVDDDSFVFVNRLMTSGFEEHKYSGRKNHCWGGYASGGPGFWLDRQSMQIIIDADLTEETADDKWIGQVLASHGIFLHDDPRYILNNISPVFHEVISICDIDINPNHCYEVQNKLNSRHILRNKIML